MRCDQPRRKRRLKYSEEMKRKAAQTMIQKKRYGDFAAARRRVYAAGSDPPALCGELRKEETALCGQ